MARISLLIAVCLPALIACEGSKNAGDGGTGTGIGDGGDGGGARATTCTTPTFTQGDCSWPEYCLNGKCVPPQNLSATGMDVNTGTFQQPFCETSVGTQQGMGNLDVDRMIEDAGLELLAPDSAVITDLNRIPFASDADCNTMMHNSALFEEDGNACKGGNMDHSAGRYICAAGEAAMFFQGHAYDPQAHFAKKEGSDLDAQFYLLYMVGPPVNFADGNFGAAQAGFIMPGASFNADTLSLDGGWSTSGGAFIAALCILGGVSTTQYPLDVKSYPVLLFLADTGTGADGGTAGNSYCTGWIP